MENVKVAVHGALGKMGQTVIGAVSKEPGLEVVACIDKKTGNIKIPDSTAEVPLYDDINRALDMHRIDVMVDFSLAGALLPLAQCVIPRGVRLVSGTTGMSDEQLAEIDELAKKHATGVIIASNFSVGSIVMMHLASIASKFFDTAEIIERHHDKKVDAPSGTALTTARGMLKNRDKPFVCPKDAADNPSRGLNYDQIPIHSIRLPGILARQEVVFGAPGQTLSIFHDAISRDCYMPGVIMAVHRVVGLKKMVFGLDKLLSLYEAVCKIPDKNNTE